MKKATVISSMAFASNDTPLIKLDNVSKSYGGESTPTVEVLRDISLTIHSGEFVAIVGASGSGKSTLMHILGCLDTIGAGSYHFAGRDIASLDDDSLARLRRETFGFVFQSYHLIPSATVRENVAIPAVYANLPAVAREQRADELLTRLGLLNRLLHRPNQLSGGQQQRVSIARALMNGGQVILADEPTGALDSQSGAEVMAILGELAAKGHTIILITHDREIANHAQRLIQIHDGRIISDTGRKPISASSTRYAGIETKEDGGIGHAHGLRSAYSQIWESFRAAWRVLCIHRFRTLLTLLGIIVGVASIIVMVGIGRGAEQKILEQMTQFGSNRLFIVPGGGSQQGRVGKLTERDVERIAEVPNVELVMPLLDGLITVRHGDIDYPTSGYGVTVDFPKLMNWPVQDGVFFSKDDERALATVAVIGSDVGLKLFGKSDPLGQYILVNQIPFQVIGVLTPKGALESTNGDKFVVFPFRTASRRVYGTTDISWISARITELKLSGQTVKAITDKLTAARGSKDFDVFDSAAAVSAEVTSQAVMTRLLGAMAVVSLMVGGIGVMNIMLMTVRERTREIGLRVAIGARRRDIVWQFLIEAGLVSGLGGLMGTVVGITICIGLSLTGIPIIHSITVIAGALLSSLVTGLVFGLIPARRAAELDPIAALTQI